LFIRQAFLVSTWHGSMISGSPWHQDGMTFLRSLLLLNADQLARSRHLQHERKRLLKFALSLGRRSGDSLPA